MSESFPTSRQNETEFYISMDDQLQEHIPFFSEHIPFSLYTQHYRCAAQDHVPFHWHEEYQLVWISHGKLQYQINEDTLLLDEHQLLLIANRQMHRAKPMDADVDTLCINFSLELFHPFLLSEVLLPHLNQYPFSYLLLPLQTSELQELTALRSLRREGLQVFTILNFLSRIFEKALLCSSAEQNHSDPEELVLFQSILEEMHSCYAEEFSIPGLCAGHLLNKNQLNSLFHKYTGTSPVQYLNSYRLHVARDLLLQTNRSVSRISSDVGYHQISHFGKQFLKKYGSSPLQYRKKYKG